MGLKSVKWRQPAAGNEDFVCRENKTEKPLTKSMGRHSERIQTNRVIDEKINIELIHGVMRTYFKDKLEILKKMNEVFFCLLF